MKKPFKFLAVAIAIILLMYAAGAFISWQINPGKWAEVGRVLLASVGLPSALLLSWIMVDSNTI